MVAARQYQRFQLTHIVLILCGDIPAAKVKYIDVFSLIHIREVTPVRRDKTGQLVCFFLLDVVVAAALIDKLRALNADFHDAIGCLVVGNIHEEDSSSSAWSLASRRVMAVSMPPASTFMI